MDLKKNKWQSYITIIIFCILFFCFTVFTIIKPSTEFSETENRVLTQRPEIEMKEIMSGRFETEYEEYLTDQFFLRDEWIGLKTSVERLLLKRESKDIYFGKDDYLIEKHTETFTSDIAQRNITILAQFTEKYKEKFSTGRMTVMIVPNAVDILKEKLPPFASPYNEDYYLKQIAASLPEGVWFDTASVLRQHTDEELFYRTDHHWKTLAAFYVYRAWAQKQRYALPGIEDYEIQTVTDCFEGTIQSKLGIKTLGDKIELFLPRKEIKYSISRDDSPNAVISLYDYQALDTKDKYAVYFGGNHGFLKVRTESDSGKRILIIKDSYANCFIPFMFEEFQEIDILDLRYTNQKLSELVTKGEYTDLLILYNASGFAEDSSVKKIVN